MDSRGLGVLVIALGALAVLVGIAIYFGWFSFFGKLPGDLRFETENTKIYFPIASMILLSLLLTLVLNLLRRFF